MIQFQIGKKTILDYIILNEYGNGKIGVNAPST